MKSQPQNLFIVILRYKVSKEKIGEFRSDHLDFLSTYYAKGLFIVSGRNSPEITGGVILAKSVSRVELENILSQDPFATGGLATYEVIEFTPTKWNKEFEGALFADSGVSTNETQDD